MSLATPLRPVYAGPPAVPGYAVGEFLGRGSSAVVWSATGPAGERVALKVFAGDRAPSRRDEVLRDTDRELILSRRVTSAHVIGAHDRLELDDGRVVLVLDLADEGSLRDVVTIRGALPLGEVVTMLIGVATALADLETGGVVHGDVAPGNVLFDADGRPLLADLSMARLVADGTSADLIGTPGFTAPEVLAGRPPSPASDVWSLGALLWYSRTGGSPPPGWVGDVHGDVAGGTPGGPGVPEVVEAVGPELRPVLVRMLADDPYARPTAAEAALAIYRAGAPEPLVLVGRHPDPAVAVTTRLRREAAETRSRRELRAAERATARSQRGRNGGARSGRWWRRTGAASSAVGRPAGVGAGETLRLAEVDAARRGSAPVAWDPQPDRQAVPDPTPMTGDGPTGPGSGAGAIEVWGGPAGRRTASIGARVSLVGGVAVLAAAGLLGLVALNGGSAPATEHLAPVMDAPATGASSAVPSPAAPAGTAGSANPAVAPGADATSAPASTTAAGGSGSAVTAVPGSADPRIADPKIADPKIADPTLADPTAVLQAIADARAAALSAADPVALVSAEPEGSSAYTADAATVARLREQRQRYRDLSFTVSAAQVVSLTGSRAVVRATVARSAGTVEGEDGSVQTLVAAPGELLRYGLTLRDGGWRLSDVMGS